MFAAYEPSGASLRVLLLGLLAPLLLLFGSGCSFSNTCDYGSKGKNGTSCKSRPDPSDDEARGWRRDSLAPRLADARKKLGESPVDGIAVNRWGEVGVRRDDGWAYTSAIDGDPVPHEDALLTPPGVEPFALRRVDAAVPERAMRAIARRDPDAEFISASAGLAYPRAAEGGDVTRTELRWKVTTKVGDRYDYYETDPAGRLRCVVTSTETTGECHPVG